MDEGNRTSECRQCQNSGDWCVEHPKGHLSLNPPTSLTPLSLLVFPLASLLNTKPTAHLKNRPQTALLEVVWCSWGFPAGKRQSHAEKGYFFLIGQDHKPQASRVFPLDSKCLSVDSALQPFTSSETEEEFPMKLQLPGAHTVYLHISTSREGTRPLPLSLAEGVGLTGCVLCVAGLLQSGRRCLRSAAWICQRFRCCHLFTHSLTRWKTTFPLSLVPQTLF